MDILAAADDIVCKSSIPNAWLPKVDVPYEYILDSLSTNSSPTDAVTVVELTTAPDTYVAVALEDIDADAADMALDSLILLPVANTVAVAVVVATPFAVNPPMDVNPDVADIAADANTTRTAEDVTVADADAKIGNTSEPNALEPKFPAPYENALALTIAIYQSSVMSKSPTGTLNTSPVPIALLLVRAAYAIRFPAVDAS